VQQRNRDRRRIGEWLRAERLRAGLNQKELSDRLKLSGQTKVSAIETGQRRLDILEFLELASILNTTAAKLATRLSAHMKKSD
jgi:transcriptional regulator with XRE-family HTH domain